jgi:uncharacterized protein
MKNTLLLVLRIYKRIISPLLVRVFGNGCRYTPTCSEYTIEAVRKLGPAKGLLLGLRRFIRCNPFFAGGYDPLPKKLGVN